jgi:hypothetical protein
MTKEVWEKREGAKMLAEYVNTTDTDYKHHDPNMNEIRTNQKRRRKLQMDKEKDNEDCQRKLELRKKWNVM